MNPAVRHPLSLTLRLTLLFAIAAMLAFAVFGWIIERSIKQHFFDEDVAELKAIASSVTKTLSTRGKLDVSTVLRQRFNDILVGHHSAVLYVTREDGSTVFASPGEHDLSAMGHNGMEPVAEGLLHVWQDAGHTYRVLTRRLEMPSPANERYTVSVAVAIDSHLRFLKTFHRTLWLMIASGIVLLGILGWVAVRRGLAPLRSIVAQIHRTSASELNTRLRPEAMPRELSDLAESFNGMLARIEEAFERLSNFSADIAHELRTPVTSLLTQSQVALSQSRGMEEYREILYSNIEEYERMAQMIGDMLLLAKTDNGQYELDRITVDLTSEVEDLFDYYEAWAEERGVSLSLTGEAVTEGDRAMLRRALSNLLSNAIRHCPAGEAVRVVLEQTSREAVIRVKNPGPPIPAEHIPRLFDRFHRVDASRHRSGDGAGLGLAIVKSIVDVHRGRIVASSTDKCTTFEVRLPSRSTSITEREVGRNNMA
ncbi:MAG TPA: heavy metal sensor histidine kinase [Gammaproteobacteria bacterium]|nr:heavy metal sensor histidine kinase [Gammaproteobacteria bacterium]